jgi:sterol desaturase/sphingolipid hydroxylase (fatty acid hydroxylase superfamily)
MAFLAAVSAQEMNWGLLNLIDLPYWLSMLLGLVLLDLAIYGQHVVSHHWKWLWSLHKIHHTDLDFDVTTAVRFHPFEILISMVYKVLLIYIIGLEPMVIIVFEVILSGSALFNHSNVYIPVKVDKWLRKLIVTPDMHRIHHSAIQKETDSNYGFALSIWDRLFGNYTDEPKYGQTGMMVGLTQYRYSHDVSIKQLLLMPFK